MESTMFVIFVFLSLWLTMHAASDLSVPVTALEYDLFRWPHTTPECDRFSQGLQHENVDTDPQNFLKTDCERFRRALACYDSFYSSLDLNTEQGRETKKDLDDHNIEYLKKQCANIQ